MELEYPSIIESSESVSRAVNEISKTGLPVIIVKDGEYFGLIDERTIRQRVTAPDKEKCSNIAEKTPVLSSESTVMDACGAFFAGRFKAIPVFEGKNIVGAVTRRTLLNEMLRLKMLGKANVGESMTSPVVTINIDANVGKARAELRKHNIRRMVVTDGEKVAGLISVFDLATMQYPMKQNSAFNLGGEKTSLDGHSVKSYMKMSVETISRGESVASAVRMMLDKNVFALIVTDGSFPMGIITAKDVLHAALHEEKQSRVFVSGLPYALRGSRDFIADSGEKMLDKLGKQHSLASLALHVKKEGSMFGVRARLSGDIRLSASAEDFELTSAVHMVLDELKKLAEKEKLPGIGKRKN